MTRTAPSRPAVSSPPNRRVLAPTAVAGALLSSAGLRHWAALATRRTAAMCAILNIVRAPHYKATESGEEIALQLLIPGDIFGIGTLLRRPITYMGNAETISDCDILVWGSTSQTVPE